MMTRRLIHTIFLIFFILLAGNLHAQTKDFQSWWEVKLDKDLAKDLGMVLEVEQRFKQNSLQYDRSLLTLTARYDVMKYLRVAGGIRGLVVADQEGSFYNKFRLNADATGRYGLGEVDLSLRVRLQYGFEEFIYFSEISSNVLVNRYRLKAAYHIFGTPIDVFASVEPWGALSLPDEPFVRRIRYAAGLGYTLGRRMKLGLRYIFEDEVNQRSPRQSHILVGGLRYSF